MYVDIVVIQNTDESAVFISRERSFQTYKIEEKESQTPLFEIREGHLNLFKLCRVYLSHYFA